MKSNMKVYAKITMTGNGKERMVMQGALTKKEFDETLDVIDIMWTPTNREAYKKAQKGIKEILKVFNKEV